MIIEMFVAAVMLVTGEPKAGVFETEQECLETVAEVASSPYVLAVSGCKPMDFDFQSTSEEPAAEETKL